MAIAVSLDIRTNVWFFLMVLDANGDGVSWDGKMLGIFHG
jgi:hypothetical protein